MKAGRLVLAGALLAAAWALGLPGQSQAQAQPSPLAEMRAAAEALGDVDPEPLALPRRDALPVTAQASGGAHEKAPESERAKDGAKDSAKDNAALAAARASARAELHAAVRSAVQSEIAREVQNIGRTANGLANGRANKESGEPSHGEAKQANEAAAQAQQARLNREVSKGRGHMYGKPLTGNPSNGMPKAGWSL